MGEIDAPRDRSEAGRKSWGTRRKNEARRSGGDPSRTAIESITGDRSNPNIVPTGAMLTFECGHQAPHLVNKYWPRREKQPPADLSLPVPCRDCHEARDTEMREFLRELRSVPPSRLVRLASEPEAMLREAGAEGPPEASTWLGEAARLLLHRHGDGAHVCELNEIDGTCRICRLPSAPSWVPEHIASML